MDLFGSRHYHINAVSLNILMVISIIVDTANLSFGLTRTDHVPPLLQTTARRLPARTAKEWGRHYPQPPSHLHTVPKCACRRVGGVIKAMYAAGAEIMFSPSDHF